ncbi:MAG: AAA family ATPase [Acidimicrobiaceae bacterium]|nr:AAA family ATPase [Acidimicrobiaceae bacterium]MYA75139.1 AAA family ATPase [Acidimicrobiaceae bacterium]MYD07215.1 AAA family ATPase [Acidimicrobiaceae bacterium]MYG56703.1 AAA family ATPase [Acidimicrobiaceae bacterium]MYI59487.1 AAA family ATPase [Acidimicrobiaceae bacterium]
MDPGQFFASSRILIVAGKGGVGKTATSASLALAAAQTGRNVLVVEVAGRLDSAPMFGVDPQGYDEHRVYKHSVDDHSVDNDSGRGRVRCRSITPDAALVDWLSNHGFARIVRRMSKSGLLEIVATATPGIKELLVLGQIKHLEQSRVADLIVVDAPAAGHALNFLKAPLAVHNTARTGVLRRQATEALEMLSDSERCRALLVTIAEETPIKELVETAFAIEDEVGLALGPVVVNGLLPSIEALDTSSELHVSDIGASESGLGAPEISDLVTAANFRRDRLSLQNDQLASLAQQLPLAQIRLPHLFTTSVGLTELKTLTESATASIEAIEQWAGS